MSSYIFNRSDAGAFRRSNLGARNWYGVRGPLIFLPDFGYQFYGTTRAQHMRLITKGSVVQTNTPASGVRLTLDESTGTYVGEHNDARLGLRVWRFNPGRSIKPSIRPNIQVTVNGSNWGTWNGPNLDFFGSVRHQTRNASVGNFGDNVRMYLSQTFVLEGSTSGTSFAVTTYPCDGNHHSDYMDVLSIPLITEAGRTFPEQPWSFTRYSATMMPFTAPGTFGGGGGLWPISIERVIDGAQAGAFYARPLSVDIYHASLSRRGNYPFSSWLNPDAVNPPPLGRVPSTKLIWPSIWQPTDPGPQGLEFDYSDNMISPSFSGLMVDMTIGWYISGFGRPVLPNINGTPHRTRRYVAPLRVRWGNRRSRVDGTKVELVAYFYWRREDPGFFTEPADTSRNPPNDNPDVLRGGYFQVRAEFEPPTSFPFDVTLSQEAHPDDPNQSPSTQVVVRIPAPGYNPVVRNLVINGEIITNRDVFRSENGFGYEIPSAAEFFNPSKPPVVSDSDDSPVDSFSRNVC